MTLHCFSSSDAHEILLVGSDGKSSIRPVKGSIVEEVDEPDLLSCDYPTTFWIRWTQGK